MLIHGLIFTYSLNVTINRYTKDRSGHLFGISSHCNAVNLVKPNRLVLFNRSYLITGGGPSGAASEQAPLLHGIRAAQSAAAALLPPGLLGGGGGGGE